MKVEIRGLRKVYIDGTRALSGLDLDLGQGMFGLLGPNGAGKTTFLSVLVLATEPTAGSRRYDDLDAARARDRPRIRRRLGYLPQDFVPVRHLSGREYLLHCAQLRDLTVGRRELRRRADELLDVVGLSRDAGRPAGHYSGGMRRRLGLAQSLIHAPDLLVVDEPTAGLDPEERIHFRNLIGDVSEHTAVVLSTHIVEDIEATCPRIGVIAGGRLLFDGAPGELLRRAAGRLWVLPGEAREVAPDLPVVARRVTAAGEPAVVVLADARPAGAEAREPVLEEAYSAYLLERGERTGDDEEAA